VLLGDAGATNRSAVVRLAAVGALARVNPLRVTSHPLLEGRIWAALHDSDAGVVGSAAPVWGRLNPSGAGFGASPPGAACAITLLPLLGHVEDGVVSAATKALAAVVDTRVRRWHR